MDLFQPHLNPSPDAKIEPFKILLHQLTAIGGKKFVDAAKEFLANQNHKIERDGPMGDQHFTTVNNDQHPINYEKSFNNTDQIKGSCTEVQTLFSNQKRDAAESSSRTNNQVEALGKHAAKLYWKPHYETSTKIFEMRKNDALRTRTNLTLPTMVPFVAGTSISRSHNILLNCQHVLAQLKMVQRLPQIGGGDPAATDFHNVAEERQDTSEVALKLTPRPFNDGMTLQFKKVLSTLYDEFRLLSREYDDFLELLSIKGINKKHIKQELRTKETLLEQKEQEILVLILLYREVINLSAQVERAESKDNIKMVDSKQTALNFSPSTSFKLKFLLQQVLKFEKLLIKPKH